MKWKTFSQYKILSSVGEEVQGRLGKRGRGQSIIYFFVSKLNPFTRGQSTTFANSFFLHLFNLQHLPGDIQLNQQWGSFPLLFLLMTTPPENMPPYRIILLSPHICQTAGLQDSIGNPIPRGWTGRWVTNTAFSFKSPLSSFTVRPISLMPKEIWLVMVIFLWLI